jgi:hypothetical protein
MILRVLVGSAPRDDFHISASLSSSSPVVAGQLHSVGRSPLHHPANCCLKRISLRHDRDYLLERDEPEMQAPAALPRQTPWQVHS